MFVNRKRAMIVIISGQLLPNFIGALHVKPDRYHLIYSQDDEFKQLKDIFQKAVSLEFPDLQSDSFISHPVDNLDIENAFRCCQAIISNEDTDYTVNITGGTKLMSYGAYRAGLDRGVTTIYVDTENNCIMESSAGKANKAPLPRLKIEHFFRLARAPFYQSGHMLKNLNECSHAHTELARKLETYLQKKLKPCDMSFYMSGPAAPYLDLLVSWQAQLHMIRFSSRKTLTKEALNELTRTAASVGGKFENKTLVHDSRDAHSKPSQADPAVRNRAAAMNIKELHAPDMKKINNDIWIQWFVQDRTNLIRKREEKSRLDKYDPTKLPAISRPGNAMIMLMGEQLLPNYLAAVHYQPAHIHIISSDHKRFDRSLQALESALRDLPSHPDIHLYNVNEFDISAIESLCANIIGLHGRGQTILNATGGTKPMAFGAMNSADKMDSSTIYVETRNNCIFCSGPRESFRFEEIPLPIITVNDFLKIADVRQIKDAKGQDQTEVVNTHAKRLKDEYVKEFRDHPQLWSSVQSVADMQQSPFPLQFRSCVQSMANSVDGIGQKGTALELALYFKLKSFPEIHDAKYSVKIDWLQVPGAEILIKAHSNKKCDIENELDVMATDGRRLAIYECKMGAWDEEALYGMNVYGDLLGGLFVDKYLVYYSTRTHEELLSAGQAIEKQLAEQGLTKTYLNRDEALKLYRLANLAELLKIKLINWNDYKDADVPPGEWYMAKRDNK